MPRPSEKFITILRFDILMREPFKKHLNAIDVEGAHGGSGRRQLILSKDDPISSQMDAMTKGFLAAGGVFD